MEGPDERKDALMKQGLLREIAKEYLVPLFSGSTLEGTEDSSAHDKLVALRSPTSIAFKANKNDDYRLILTRPQPFATERQTIVPEIGVVRAFIDSLRPMIPSLKVASLKHDLLSTFSRRIVAKAMSSIEEREETILLGIDQLTKWASRRYEGSPIAATIGFRHLPQGNNAATLSDISAHDFSAVLSNGHDTLLGFDFAGRFISHETLPFDDKKYPYCPFRQVPIGAWTTKDPEPRKRRVALCLNRSGEILVFRDGQLLFARRSGRWSFLTHEPILTQMGTPQDAKIRRAVYETCLDASFARTGGCIGIVSSSHAARLQNVVVNEADYVKEQKSVKSRSVARMIKKKKFHELDRRLRQELVAIDGATVLSHEAEVLAVGSILKIIKGSESGGRLAAAKALGYLGLGIKISQDGAIIGFRLGREEPAFQIM
jgi:hypothetical protein